MRGEASASNAKKARLRRHGMTRWAALPVLLLFAAGCLGSPDPAPVEETGPAASFPLGDPRIPHRVDGTPALPANASLADPGFPVFGPLVRMNQTFSAHRETSLALGPAGSGVLFACDPSGVPNLGEGQSHFFLSTDNGTTWRDLDIERDQDDLRQQFYEGGDCDVMVGPSGELWTADSWLGSLSIGLSRDGGESWRGTPLGGTSPVADRPWLAVDGAGVLHMTYQDVQFGMPSAIWYTRVLVTENALAFTPAVSVTGPSPDGAFTWTGNLVVSDDGQELWSVYTRRAGPVTTDLEGSGPETVWVARSTDAGLTWTSELVSRRPSPASFLYPALARDEGGLLHVVFAQRTETAHPVFHSFSSDGGSAWSEPAVVRDGVAAYSPWVAAGAAGQAAIQWYGSPDPKAQLDDNETEWFTYWATVDVSTGAPDYLSGTTTLEPLFVGEQGETPEFNMVRLDAAGRMHLGLSVMNYDEDDELTYWTAEYQAQVAGPGLVA